MKKNRTVKIIAFALVLFLLFGIVTFAVVFDSMKKKEENKKLAEFTEATYDLKLRRQELYIEFENVEKRTLNRLADGSFMGIVFNGLDKQLLTNVLPQLTEGEPHINAMIALSHNELPGMEGKITRAEFDELCALGFEVCVFVDTEGDVAEELTALYNKLSTEGIPMPNIALFAEGTYKAAYDGLVKSFGIEYVLHHGDDKLPLIEANVGEGVWHPGIIGWNTRGYSSSLFQQIVSSGGIAYFEVKFEGKSNVLYNGTENARTKAFGRMLETFREAILNDELGVTDIKTAKESRAYYLQQKDKLLLEVALRKQEIIEEIAEIDKEISRIYYEICE